MIELTDIWRIGWLTTHSRDVHLPYGRKIPDVSIVVIARKNEFPEVAFVDFLRPTMVRVAANGNGCWMETFCTEYPSSRRQLNKIDAA